MKEIKRMLFGICGTVRDLYGVLYEIVEFEAYGVAFAVVAFHNAACVGKSSVEFISQVFCTSVDSERMVV